MVKGLKLMSIISQEVKMRLQRGSNRALTTHTQVSLVSEEAPATQLLTPVKARIWAAKVRLRVQPQDVNLPS